MLYEVITATGEVVGTVPVATPEDVNAAVESAQAAYRDWSRRSAAPRPAMPPIDGGEAAARGPGRCLDRNNFV